MKEYTKQIMHELNAAFNKEEERILAEKRAASKKEIKEISWLEFVANLKSRNIADNMFKVLETVPPNERLPIILEMIESLDKKELKLPPLIFLRAALYAANFPAQVYSNLAIIKPGKPSKERAQIATKIILSLSKLAEEAAKQQKIKNKFDIEAYQHKSNAVQNTSDLDSVISAPAIVDFANNPHLTITEEKVMAPITAPVSILNMAMPPIEVISPELPKLLQQLETAEIQTASLFEESCDALSYYAKTVGSALHNLNNESELCKDYISEYLYNQIDELNKHGSRLLLKVNAKLADRVSYVTGETLTHEHIKTFTDEIHKLQQDVELHQQQFIQIANMKISSKSSNRMDFLHKSIHKLLKAFRAVLNKLQEIVQKIWACISRANIVENENNDPAKRQTLLHSNKINKPADYPTPDKKPDNFLGPEV